MAAGAAQADALPTPAMAGPIGGERQSLTASICPTGWVDAGGKVYVGGAVTGLAYWQSNPTFVDQRRRRTSLHRPEQWRRSAIQKTDGWLQFYAQFGAYSLPTVGVPYTKASAADAGKLRLRSRRLRQAVRVEGDMVGVLIRRRQAADLDR